MQQGDSLCLVLFIVYLKVALHDLWLRLPSRTPTNTALLLDVAHADDAYFISSSHSFLDEIKQMRKLA